MDLFDMTKPALDDLHLRPTASPSPSLTPPSIDQSLALKNPPHPHPSSTPDHVHALAEGLSPLRDIPFLILGVQSDILFTVEQQREMADGLRMAGNDKVSYYELGGVWGHDTFLLDVRGVGGVVRGFLQSNAVY